MNSGYNKILYFSLCLIVNYLYKTKWLVVSITDHFTCGCATIHIRKINIQITDEWHPTKTTTLHTCIMNLDISSMHISCSKEETFGWKLEKLKQTLKMIYITSNMDSECLLTTLFMLKDTMGYGDSSDIYWWNFYRLN